MALVSKLTPDMPPQMGAPLAKQAAQAKVRDRLSEFLAKGANESPDQLAGKYGELFDSGGGFGFGTASNLGMDPAASGAINERMKGLLAQNVGFQRANLLRGSTGDYLSRQNQFQSIHDSVRKQRELEERILAQKKAAKKAKRAGLGAALGGLAGAGVGAFVGGAPGAMVGSGIGSSIGGQSA